MPVRHLDVSLPLQTLRYLDASLPGHFAPLDVSIPAGCFVTSLDVSPPVSKLVISHTVTTSANLNILWTDDKELPT